MSATSTPTTWKTAPAASAAPAAPVVTPPTEAPAPAPAPALRREALPRSDAAPLAAQGAAPSPSPSPSLSFSPSPLAPLRAALAAPAGWTWQRETGAAAGLDPRVADWLALLDGVAGDRWQPADAVVAGGDELRLVRDGRTVHRFVVQADGVAWHGPDGARRAALDPAFARRLQAALPDAPPEAPR